jgi:ribokinase
MSSHARTGIAIVGSANMDLVFATERIPRPGETLLARSADRYAGGKGLNQAVAAARSGARTTFIASIGTDDNGDALFGTMVEVGIDGALVRRGEEPTGQAFIVVSAEGENTIVVASGANGELVGLTPEDRAAVAATSVLLMQLELPLSVVIDAAKTAKEAGTIVMLNAAPAAALDSAVLETLDYLIVNEHEVCLIADLKDLDAASRAVAATVPRLIVTLGSDGAALYDDGVEQARVPAPRVETVDSTGAGDTFCGAFAVAIAEGREFADAAEFATAAAALSVQTEGAVSSIPERSLIDNALADARASTGGTE